MNKLALPISIAILLVILIATFCMKKRCVCMNDQCSKCSRFSLDHFFKKETFASMASEVPGFYTINTSFPKLTNKKVSPCSEYWL